MKKLVYYISNYISNYSMDVKVNQMNVEVAHIEKSVLIDPLSPCLLLIVNIPPVGTLVISPNRRLLIRWKLQVWSTKPKPKATAFPL